MSEPLIQVALTFDFDAISPWLQVTTTSPSFISRGEFGPIGLERIRKVLAEYRLRGTFFTPGHTALAYPQSVESLVADGHEIGHHGWVHEGLSAVGDRGAVGHRAGDRGARVRHGRPARRVPRPSVGSEHPNHWPAC